MRPGAALRAARCVALATAVLSAGTAATASAQAPPTAEATPPADAPLPGAAPGPGEGTPPGEGMPPGEGTPPEAASPGEVLPDSAPAVDPAATGEVVPSDATTGEATPDPTSTAPTAPTSDVDGARTGPPKPKKKTKKKKKKTKKKEPHRVNRGTEYRVGLYPAGYVQGRGVSVGVQAGIRQRLEPKKNNPLVLDLGYEYEPFSTKTLGFPEEDETTMSIGRTLVQPIHILAGRISREAKWGKLVTTSLDLTADAWWPSIRSQQRWSVRLTPGIRIGRATGVFGELVSELYYKKFPNYYIDSVMRRIDQEGGTPTAIVGYNVRKLVRAAAGFSLDYTHYLDAHYNAVAADGTYVRSDSSKNYIDTIPFAELLLRPARGLRIRARYAFERQKTQHYDRVMTGRDEFASLTPKFFEGYYDYRRHRANLWISWEFRDRLRLAAAGAAWVRHFDVYEARTADNFWTGELRLDAELEGSLEVAVRVASIKRKRMQHDFFVSLLGSHVSRRSNMKREISLATNFDISRVLLGFEVRGH